MEEKTALYACIVFSVLIVCLCLTRGCNLDYQYKTQCIQMYSPERCFPATATVTK